VTGNYVCIFTSEWDSAHVYIVPEEVMDVYPQELIFQTSLEDTKESRKYLSRYTEYLATVSIVDSYDDKKFSCPVPITHFYTFCIS
jgi:hypothetical protein